MSENKNNYGVYPTLPKDPTPVTGIEVGGGGEAFRLATCSNILGKMKENIDNDISKRKKK